MVHIQNMSLHMLIKQCFKDLGPDRDPLPKNEFNGERGDRKNTSNPPLNVSLNHSRVAFVGDFLSDHQYLWDLSVFAMEECA